MTAELHRRLVNIASLIILPVLALPFGIGKRRNLRSYRFAVALAILIAYHEIVEQGAVMTQATGIRPCSRCGSPSRCCSRSRHGVSGLLPTRSGADRFDPVFDRMSDIAGAIRRRFLPVAAAGT